MAFRMKHPPAFRMKHWIAATAFGFALVAIWRLPPEAFSDRNTAVQSAEQIRLQELDGELRRTGEVLRRLQWVDSLSRLAVAEADDGVLVATPSREGSSTALDEQEARLAEMAHREIEALGQRDRSVLFGFVFQPFEHAQIDGMGISARERLETFVGRRDGQPYCLQVRVTGQDRLDRAIANKLTDFEYRSVVSAGELLGVCHFYLRYGLPGERIGTWMERGGSAFATSTKGAVRLENDDLVRGRRTVLGYSNFGYQPRPIEMDQCLAGLREACGHIFRDPTMADPVFARQIGTTLGAPVGALGGGGLFRSVVRDTEYLLADLEAEFGREAFERFWRSESDVDEAFRAAFGVDVGAWTVEWVERSTGIDPPGPGLPRRSSSGAMLAVALLLGVAYVRNRERSVV